ncbi:hypothetical protein B0F90DRAFT_1918459 [Multifurca ochricompacta]|uniref:Uncharacterized protein n=1 Tax=Multifurca ochricompacta TaxID=376703 RepID=A0AAD4M1P5_9AGAM|nr:hypothetical protein B0F90DRAFT_1918459 [Multifurca ochricompacta]
MTTGLCYLLEGFMTIKYAVLVPPLKTCLKPLESSTCPAKRLAARLANQLLHSVHTSCNTVPSSMASPWYTIILSRGLHQIAQLQLGENVAASVNKEWSRHASHGRRDGLEEGPRILEESREGLNMVSVVEDLGPGQVAQVARGKAPCDARSSRVAENIQGQ